MEFIIGLIVLAGLYFYFSGKGKYKSTAPKARAKARDSSSKDFEEVKKSFLPPMPAGFQIYAGGCPVAGMQHRKEEAIRFAQSSNQELTLQRDLNNEFDKNAIKLIGLSGSKQFFIGFLPKELSAQIVATDLLDKVKARLGRIYLSSSGFLEIQYQVIGPKPDKKVFDEFLNNQPADSSQKDYLKFFGLPVARGLTAGQAGDAIEEHRKIVKPDELDEWNGLSNIIEELDDKDNREGYSLKKVSKTVLMEALTQLKGAGKSYKYLSDNIDEVAEKIIELKPELEA